MIELYFRPMACSLAARIALYEAGIDARYTQVDLATKRLTGSNSDFLDVSNKGQVPVLVLDDGTHLTENAAILQYIADLTPESGLAPAPGDTARYRLQEWLAFIGMELHKAGLFPQLSAKANDGARAFAREYLEGALQIVSVHLSGSQYLIGDGFTVADGYLVWVLLLSHHLRIDVGGVNEAYLQRMLKRPALRRAVGEEREMALA